jgi:hypothetical protein
MEEYRPSDIVDGLKEIVEDLGGVPEEGKVEFWQTLADRLSRIAGKTESWGWRYPAQVHAGQTSPSKLFARAVVARRGLYLGDPAAVRLRSEA